LRRAYEDRLKQIKVPLRIGDEIMVRSLANAAHRTKTKVVGAVHGDFILIKEPLVVINNRLVAIFDQTFECSYFAEGYRYSFVSKYKSHAFQDIVCISYPEDAEISKVRKDRRIRVNIETKYAVFGSPKWFSADMVDISKGGCRLILKSNPPLSRGMEVLLVFSLPNEEEVNDLRAQVVRSTSMPDIEATDIGLAFVRPHSELAKVESFCEFCLFFEVE